MNIFKKIATAAALGASMLMAFTPGIAAAATPGHSASGLIDYSVGDVGHIANFNVKQTDKDCSSIWNVYGKYVMNFYLNGDTTAYLYDVTLSKSGSKISVSGKYPAGGPYIYSWTGNNGTVTGNSINLTVHYTLGAPSSTVMTMTGTINPDGTISGTWTDNFGGGTRNGTWSTKTGNAKAIGCDGKGKFEYADAGNNSYLVKASCVYINGKTATFSGPISDASTPSWNGQYLIAQVVDNSPDTISGSFVSSNPHCNTAGLTNGPFNVSFGNIIVK